MDRYGIEKENVSYEEWLNGGQLGDYEDRNLELEEYFEIMDDDDEPPEPQPPEPEPTELI